MISSWFIVPNLGIRTQNEFLNTNDNLQGPVQNVICKYEDHPSIISVKKCMKG